MNESGATAFEVREMARRIRGGGILDLVRGDALETIAAALDDLKVPDPRDEAEGIADDLPIGDHYTNAILVEALTLLAETKEAERAARR